MPLDYESAGFGYYAGYACPGLPWVKDDTLSGVNRYQFPMITQEIKVFNMSSGSINVGFSPTAFVDEHFLTVKASGSLCIPVRIADLYVSGSGGQSVQIFAALSVVDRRQMLVLSGSWDGV